jgi:hypothetical protein
VADEEQESFSGRDTVIDSDEFSFLQLDEFKKNEEVRQIADDETFREIQAQSRALKSRRQSDADSG